MSPHELSELAPIAATLNKESNEVNRLIVSLNEELAALNLGISVWVATPAQSDPDCTIGFTSFGEGEIEQVVDEEHKPSYKFSSYKWQLAIRRKLHPAPTPDHSRKTVAQWMEEQETESVEPVLKASRDLRIEALQEAPLIIRMLMDQANAKILAIQKAKELVSELSAKRGGKA
jgi:hypothetical protein